MLMDNSTSQATCANFLARTILSSLHETLGNELFAHLLREADCTETSDFLPPDDLRMQYPLQRLGNAFSAIESLAGKRAQRGLLQRCGRACFLSLQRRSIPSLGIFTAQVLTLPKILKVKRCAEILAGYFHYYLGFQFLVEPYRNELKWIFKVPNTNFDPSLCSGFSDLWGGFWYELLYTLSGGKPHLIEIIAEAGEKQSTWGVCIPYLPFEG